MFNVTVDYSKNLAAMVEDARFGDLQGYGPLLTEENFPYHGEGVRRVKIEIIRVSGPTLFGYYLTKEEVLHAGEEGGFRQATLPEILALATIHPRAQERYGPIVALGTVGKHPKGEVVAVLNYEPLYGRSLSLDWYDQSWPGFTNFAIVKIARKRTKHQG